MKITTKMPMSGIVQGTNFNSETTCHHDQKNGPQGLPLMSDMGKRLADVSPTCNSYVVHTASTAAVKGEK